MIIHGDCLIEMKAVESESINMIYLDPPFFTQREQKLTSEKVVYSFDDRWSSKTEYLEYLRKRLFECRRVLKSDGSIFLHCDSRTSLALKDLMDEIFGDRNFINEIIWTYRRWSNSKKGLLNAHQTILYYSKTDAYKFNTIYTEYSPTTNIDQILQDRVRNEHGKTVYKKDEKRNTILSHEKKGVPLSDVWDIPYLNPKAKERVGYPTQKPIELLERIIKISTDEGDIVLDPFCGSGTTIIAASLLNRNYIGIDENIDAIELTKERLLSPVKTESQLLLKGKETYDTKSDTEKNILNEIDCNIVQRNRGIDAIMKKHFFGKPVAIRIQKNNESIEDALNVLHAASVKKKCAISFLIKTVESDSSKMIIPEGIIVLDSQKVTIEKELMNLEKMKNSPVNQVLLRYDMADSMEEKPPLT